MIPGLDAIFKASPVKTGAGRAIAEPTLGGVLSGFFDIILVAAGFLMFFWIIWGVFHYIFAGGNKDGLAKARSRIIWAVVGFIFILLAFSISQFLEQVVKPNSPPVQDVRRPT